jgi:hypothetical protein
MGLKSLPQRAQTGRAATKITPSLPSPLEGEGKGGGDFLLNKISRFCTLAVSEITEKEKKPEKTKCRE